MFYDVYASIEAGGKRSDFVGFLNRDIYPRQKKFNDLYRILSGTPLIPLVPAQPVPKVENPSQPSEPAPKAETPDQSGKPKAEIITRQETREEAVPYQTITKENADLPKGEKRLVTKGVAGVRTVVAEVKMQGETLVSRIVISDTITKPAIDEVVEIGIKEVKKKIAKTPDKKDGGETVVGKKDQQDLGKSGRVLPRTNAVPSLLSFVGVALAGLTGLFVKNRKK
ncbi:G5 domain-containing protein [Streptococcus cuniculi]|uniref:LPXTG cell wall anchor domain-containing protein n=1 Tax=Streptococcus cuniculi TaxID=1432788 RepID=A0A4Y9JAC8_9STRE|nr:G5 domain-containing protein [Streptococcus cuniculi]MBF0778557.1 G5 domain-containing protein [Streptococcus cuniculi]TFU97491.1 LPXTG cell wall anchor domain-containing protein [Streptococcus cuniculi]